MSEVNENVQAETQETIQAEKPQEMIEIKEPGKVKKALKWVIGGIALIATGITGFLLGKNSSDDDNDSAEAEAPQDE